MSSHTSPAETYEAFMVPFRFQPWANELLDRVALTFGVRMLDLACGTGIVARVASARLRGNGTIVGVDMNPAMIEVAARVAADEGFSIEWQVGKAESLPFADASFDIVTIQQALQFFPDKLAALRECHRVLAPEGTLAIGIWSSLEKQGIQQNYAEAIERVTGSASMHAPYGTATEDSLRDLLGQAGFGEIAIEEVTIELTYDDSSTFVAQMVESTSAGVPTMHGRSDAERAELAAAIAADMQSAVERNTVRNQVVTHSTSYIVVARAATTP